MKNLTIEMKWALIFALMGIVWMGLERMAGLHSTHIDKHPIYTNLVAIPAIAIYVFALLEKRRNFYNGFMSYKQGFITGLIITVFVAALSPLTQYITSTIISPEYFPNVIKYVVTNGQMTLVEAENYFNLKKYMMQAAIGALIMGIITSAIVAIFTKKKPKTVQSQAVFTPNNPDLANTY